MGVVASTIKESFCHRQEGRGSDSCDVIYECPQIEKSLYLYSLVGVAHHSNEKIYENNCSDKKIEGKNNLEEFQSPIINSVGHL